MGVHRDQSWNLRRQWHTSDESFDKTMSSHISPTIIEIIHFRKQFSISCGKLKAQHWFHFRLTIPDLCLNSSMDLRTSQAFVTWPEIKNKKKRKSSLSFKPLKSKYYDTDTAHMWPCKNAFCYFYLLKFPGINIWRIKMSFFHCKLYFLLKKCLSFLKIKLKKYISQKLKKLLRQ